MRRHMSHTPYRISLSIIIASTLLLSGAFLAARSVQTTAAAPASSATVASYQCFYTTADTYAWNTFPVENYGTETTVRISAGDAGANTSVAYFGFDLSAIPPGSTILDADFELYLDNASISASYILRAAQSSWSESTLTWANQPGVTGLFDQQTHNETSGWKEWNAVQPVQEWVAGTRTNHGLAIVIGGLLDAPTTFSSREAVFDQRPKLCVQWTDSAISTDLVADALEVTQAVQDLNNNVRLAAGKRTFVRFHVHSTSGRYRTIAQLEVSGNGNSTTLYPVNPGAGHIVVGTTPDRDDIDQSFLFELPSSYTQGAVTLKATVNPLLSWRTSRYPPETSYANNSATVSVTFEEVPKIGLIMYRGAYNLDGAGGKVTYTTAFTDVYQTRSWLQRAYPISDLWMTVRHVDFGMGSIVDPMTRTLTYPTSDDVNRWLTSQRLLDLSEQQWYEDKVGSENDIRYYGMVDNRGGFMRGKAPLDGRVGSGPTGRAASWDSDGIFGDWYTGHELGHSYDRLHVQGTSGGASGTCGGEVDTDSAYPHANGFISTATNGNSAFFGFDVGTREIFGPRWRDVMTYCANQWISEYTYEGIMDYLQASVTPLSAPTQILTVTDRLLVVGTTDAAAQSIDLQPLFILPDAPDVAPRVPGNFAIVLRSDDHSELARYAFTPTEMGPGPGDPELDDQDEEPSLLISELVPYVAGANQVIVEGPSGTLATVSAGAAVPNVAITAPNGGEFLSGDTIQVTWTASDTDGDPLAFLVQFSPDNGATWETLAQNLTGTSVELDRSNIQTTSDGLFRVWVTDGIHTNRDTSDAVFRTATRRPEVEIISPQPGTVVAVDQTLNLEVRAYSPNTGSLETDQIRWVSTVDGLVGMGEQVSVSGLTPGVHAFVVAVDDDTALQTASVTNVIVVDNPSLLPVPPAGLHAAPMQLLMWPQDGLVTDTLSINNQSGTNPIAWQAVASESWVAVDKQSGTTPDNLEVTVDASELAPGSHIAEIQLTSVDVPDETVSVQVVVQIPRLAAPSADIGIFLPLIVR